MKTDWEHRTASIVDANGQVVFALKDVEAPKTWSQTAINIVASKYFRQGETSVRQLLDRVVDALASHAKDPKSFGSELFELLVTQKMAFNSPVWFNLGVEKKPQCSACFIISVQDSMESILDLAKTEGMLFKFGSGTGTNFSTLRSSKEPIFGGGTASGPVSFLRGFDAFAGVIKSGGKTRRAAKMVILNVDHPDILEFIDTKKNEEEKAAVLIREGYSPEFNEPGGAYDSVFFQNANHSVRVTDEFMRAVEKDADYDLKAVLTHKPMQRVRAREVWRKIAQAAWRSGDPGVQFDSTINRFHTCKASGRINASNPCSEYMFLDDSACNLASLNLMRFRKADGQFDIAGFQDAIAITIESQDVLVDLSSYPTKKIEKNSQDFRPLGLGYANLGALLMSLGMPYDSDEGRAFAAALTALMGGHAYLVSSQIAKSKQPFAAYVKNRDSFLDVISQQKQFADQLTKGPAELVQAARLAWEQAFEMGKIHGFRNAQVTALAPTGTIGLMMDCDTLGVEPDIALVKYKKLVGGGLMKIVNQTVPLALERLGYNRAQIDRILEHLEKTESIEGARDLMAQHLPVFDCAFRAPHGSRSIAPMGHVSMMGAVQPFLSGAISKTVNLPNEISVEEIEEIYLEAWKKGLKSIAIYRDGCKQSQAVCCGGCG